MKKIFVTAMLASLIFSGCSSEEPKEQPVKEPPNQAIQTAADKAHEVVDKTATASQSLTEKATEIMDTAKKAASDMSATIQKDSKQVTEKEAETQEESAAPDTHK